MNTAIGTLGDRLVELLGLDYPPVAIVFRASVPTEGEFFDLPMSEVTPDGRRGRVAAPCVFWMHAHERTFHTLPEDHGNCSVGRFTHGLAQAADIVDKADVGALLEVGWVTMAAFAEVASLSWRPAAITYGPLNVSGNIPDVVLLRLSPRQMMQINDAVRVEFSGKPQCQILPRASDGQVFAASMGCALSRARTGMGDDEMTCAFPGSRLDELVTNLEQVVAADRAVSRF
jgi:uncharacterized protein (DUF169 family)